jgi:hypothetical protein
MRRALTAVTAAIAVLAVSGWNSGAGRIGCGTPVRGLPRAAAFASADTDDPPFVGAVQAGRQVLGIYTTRVDGRLRAVVPGAAAPLELSSARVESAAVASTAGCGLVAWQPAAGGAAEVAGIDRAGRWHEPVAVDLGVVTDQLRVAANGTTLVVEGTSVDYRSPAARVATVDGHGRARAAVSLAGVVPIVANIALADDGSVWISGLHAPVGAPFAGPLALARLTPEGRLVRLRSPVPGRVTAVAVAVAGTRRLLVAAAGRAIEAFDGVGATGWSKPRTIATVPDNVYSLDVALNRDGAAVVAWTRADSARSSGSDATQAVGIAVRPARGAFGRARDLGPYSVLDGLGLDARDQAVVGWGTSDGIIAGNASGPPSAVVLRVGNGPRRIISGGYTDAVFIACEHGGAGGVWVGGGQVRSRACS